MPTLPDAVDLGAEIGREPFVAGLLGALVSLRAAPGKSWWERCFNVLCGGIIAGYLAPFVTDWLGWDTPSALSATAFVCGLAGMTVVSVLLTLFRSIDWKTLIENRFKKGD